MASSPGPVLTDIETRVAERLTDVGVRFTRGRTVVARALGRAEGPRSAADLYETLRPRMPMSSLYRTLTVLADAGVLVRSHDAAGVTLYELDEWLRGHHHHLVCVECGRVEDVDVPEPLEESLADLVDAIAAAGDFVATGHRIDVEGRCARCR